MTVHEPLANMTVSEPNGLAWTLARLAQARDVQAWSILIEQIGQDIQRLAMRLTGDFALAEDAVQETLMHLRDHADRFVVRSSNGDEDARRWILGVASNVSLEIARRHRRQLRRDDLAGHAEAAVATLPADPSERAKNADESRILRREIAELPVIYGQVLTLHYFADQDYPALASHLRVSVNTVRIRVHRGLKVLRERLDRCGVTLSIAALTGLLSNLGAAPVAAVALPASTLGIISSSAVATTTFASAPAVASGGFMIATVLSTVLAATIALMGLSLGWFSSATNPAESASVSAVQAQSLLAVEPPAPLPLIPPGLGAGVPVKPFIMVVKTDQKEKNSGRRSSRSEPNQFMLPLSPDYAYDFTVNWGDGSSEVIRSPLSAALVKLLDQEVTVKKGNFKLKDVVAWLPKATHAHIMVDPQYVNRLRQQDVTEVALFTFDKEEKTTLRQILKDMHKDGYFVAYHKRDEAVMITDSKGDPGDLLITHTYAKPGTYAIQVTENVLGGFPAVFLISRETPRNCLKFPSGVVARGKAWNRHFLAVIIIPSPPQTPSRH